MVAAPPVVGGLQGGPGNANSLLGIVRALDSNAPKVQAKIVLIGAGAEKAWPGSRWYMGTEAPKNSAMPLGAVVHWGLGSIFPEMGCDVQGPRGCAAGDPHSDQAPEDGAASQNNSATVKRGWEINTRVGGVRAHDKALWQAFA